MIRMLAKVSKVARLLQRDGNAVNFTELATALRDSMVDTSVYVISRKGKLLGHSLAKGFESTAFDANWLDEGRVPDELRSEERRVGKECRSRGRERESK